MKRKIAFLGFSDLNETAQRILQDNYDIVYRGDVIKFVSSLNKGLISASKFKHLIGEDGLVIFNNCNMDMNFSVVGEIMESFGMEYKFYHASGRFVGYDTRQGFNLIDVYKNAEVSPTMLHLELSSACNIHCRYCFSHGKNSHSRVKPEMMTWEALNNICEYSKNEKTLNGLYLVGRGETFMHPEWFEMTSHVLNQTSLNKVLLSTNGMLLNEENARKLENLPCDVLVLQVSLDGLSPEDTEYWREGSKYETIKENLYKAQAILSKVNKVRFIINSAVVLPREFTEQKYNEYELLIEAQGMNQWLEEDFPSDFKVVTKCVFHYGFDVDSAQLEEVDTSPLMAFMRIGDFNRFDSIAVLANGDVSGCPCSNDIIVGNVLHDNMYEVWRNNDGLNKIRDNFRNGKPPCDCFQNPSVKKQKILVRK